MKKKKKTERLTLSSLVSDVAGMHKNLYRQDVEEIVKFLRNRIIDMLAEGKRVELRGFGTFGKRQRIGHIGRNPRNGDPVYIAERAVPHFKPAKEMRERANSH